MIATDKTVSVIVPVYNTEKYLSKCLESIINQSYKSIEIIIVNDGSTDCSEHVILDYQKKDSRIHYFYKENGGLSSARNFALKFAKGDYLLFVDSDDWIDENLIKECVDDTVKYGSDVVCFGFTMIDENRKSCFTKCCNNEGHLVLNRSQALDYLIKEDIIQSHVCNKLFRKSLFDNILFPVGKNYEDSYVTHKIFLQAEIITHINKPYYYYCLRNGSICHTPTEQNLLDMIGSHIQRYLDLEEYMSNSQKSQLLSDIKKYYIKARRYIDRADVLKQYELWIKKTSKAIKNNNCVFINYLFLYSCHDNFFIKIGYSIKNIMKK